MIIKAERESERERNKYRKTELKTKRERERNKYRKTELKTKRERERNKYRKTELKTKRERERNREYCQYQSRKRNWQVLLDYLLPDFLVKFLRLIFPQFATNSQKLRKICGKTSLNYTP